MLHIVREHLADTAILQCSGRIVAGPEAESLKDAVACEADKRLVILDLAAVDAIDARGLGLLVFFQTLGFALGFELELANPSPRVRKVLDLTRLDFVLEISHSEDAELPISEHAAV
jgi:anti-sigma B factor antagonist